MFSAQDLQFTLVIGNAENIPMSAHKKHPDS